MMSAHYTRLVTFHIPMSGIIMQFQIDVQNRGKFPICKIPKKGKIQIYGKIQNIRWTPIVR